MSETVLEYSAEETVVHLEPRGPWTVNTAAKLEQLISGIFVPHTARKVEINLGSIEALDTAGAWLLARTIADWKSAGLETEFTKISENHRLLLDEVSEQQLPDELQRVERGWLMAILEDTGRSVAGSGQDAVRVTAFLGASVAALAAVMRTPSRLRIKSIVHHMEHAGFRSIGIIGLLSFLIGGIIAQQGAFQLRKFGAEALVVDMVGILVLRELGVLVTAIMFAGRSGSAFTAELGAMRMREEIDAMRIIGLDPIETLILPRLIALVVTLPMVTFIADIMGLIGGGLVAKYYMDMSPDAFIARLRDGIGMNTFLVGLFKAPFMALMIGLIACVEGLKVKGSAESLGRQTTASVVKGIFVVIVLDAIFAIFLSQVNW